MTTQAIICALKHSIELAHKAQVERGPKEAEEILRYTQRLWNYHRPLRSHTEN